MAQIHTDEKNRDPQTYAAIGSAMAAAALLLVPAPTQSGAGEWITLFNGRDLAGWQVVGEASGGWGVTDGVLHPTRPGGWLSTEEQYGDFELRMEFNVPPGGNSGVFLRAPHEGRTSRVGLEIQLIDDFTDDYGELEPWQLTGALYHVEPAVAGAAKPAGQWQTLDIRLVGTSLRVTLNGKVVVETKLDGHSDKADEHPGLKRTRGYIGLQNYGGGQKVQFRNIRLRKIGD